MDPAHRGHILVLDDSPDIQSMLQRMLTYLGYQPTSVTTIHAATAAVQAQGYDLLLSNCALPDGSGLDFIAQLQQTGMRLPVIVMSGTPLETIAAHAAAATIAVVLLKPFALADLQRALQATLGPDRSTAPQQRTRG